MKNTGLINRLLLTFLCPVKEFQVSSTSIELKSLEEFSFYRLGYDDSI